MSQLDKKIGEIIAKRNELEQKLSDPTLVKDAKKYAEVNRSYRDLGEIIDAHGKCKQIEKELEQARELLDDPEMAEMAGAEIEEAEKNLEAAEKELELLMLPKDPNDDRNTILEIRAGTGGDEAALFAGDLFRMYSRYAEIIGWKIEILSGHESDLGGYKEVIFLVSGEGVYSRLKFEGGTHRVQRVPATEGSGRIHTSAVTVAVMAEADEVDVEIKAEEIRVDVFRSGGPGGQSVNTTDSAVRITHLPTGLIVSCQDEKSQHKNKAKAMKVLRSRLLERAQDEAAAAHSAARKAQVGTGDRSGRIRTYNFPQNRLSDHRINLTLYNLDLVMEGEMNPVIDPLIEHHQMELLKAVGA